VAVPPEGEKYFCVLDCHLAYRVASITPAPGTLSKGRLWLRAVRTRVDETTMSARRPLEAP
jgi:hypothetical protein